jgi:hypothetical protein
MCGFLRIFLTLSMNERGPWSASNSQRARINMTNIFFQVWRQMRILSFAWRGTCLFFQSHISWCPADPHLMCIYLFPFLRAFFVKSEEKMRKLLFAKETCLLIPVYPLCTSDLLTCFLSWPIPFDFDSVLFCYSHLFYYNDLGDDSFWSYFPLEVLLISCSWT